MAESLDECVGSRKGTEVYAQSRRVLSNVVVLAKALSRRVLSGVVVLAKGAKFGKRAVVLAKAPRCTRKVWKNDYFSQRRRAAKNSRG